MCVTLRPEVITRKTAFSAFKFKLRESKTATEENRQKSAKQGQKIMKIN